MVKYKWQNFIKFIIIYETIIIKVGQQNPIIKCNKRQNKNVVMKNSAATQINFCIVYKNNVNYPIEC
jgi:hypothetical protein